MTTTIKTADEILAENIPKIESSKTKEQSYNTFLQNLKQELTLGKCKETLLHLETRLTNQTKRIKQYRDLYLINYAKLTIDDNLVTEVIGNFTIWKKKIEEINTIQQCLLDCITIGKDNVKVLLECTDIKKQLSTEEK